MLTIKEGKRITGAQIFIVIVYINLVALSIFSFTPWYKLNEAKSDDPIDYINDYQNQLTYKHQIFQWCIIEIIF